MNNCHSLGLFRVPRAKSRSFILIAGFLKHCADLNVAALRPSGNSAYVLHEKGAKGVGEETTREAPFRPQTAQALHPLEGAGARQ